MLSFKLFFQERRFFAPAFMYVSFALVFSTWIVYIPFIVERLNISEGKLGFALFMASLGSLVMIPVSNRLIDRLGVGRQAFWGFILYGVSLYGIFWANSYTWLIIALFYYGMTSAIFSIAMNSMVAEIEKQAGKFIMTATHGFWSIGGIIGASLGSFVAGKFNMPLVHITVLLVLVLTVLFWLRKEYLQVKSSIRIKSVRRPFPFKPLIVIASIGMLMMASEGAIADWSGLYLKHVVLVAAQYLGLGYAFFSAGMALGRFTGDALSYRFGSWKLLSIAMATSLLGFGLVLSTVALVSFLGFFVIGLGFSIIVPELYRMASNIEGVRPADGISIIAATSNIGMLAGPAILGFIADTYGLFYSFVSLAGFVSLALLFTFIRRF
jgi:MFS family permease